MKTIVFFDGQNLYHRAKELWAPRPQVGGSPYGYPGYDVEKLAHALVKLDSQRILSEIRFYTGVPDPKEDYFWHGFWNNKLRYLASRGIHVYRGRINPGGQEKGVDVSLAIDLIRLTYEQRYDVAIIVSQDWDFGPAVALAKEIAKDQNKQLRFFSAFPYESNPNRARRGVPGTTWIHIDKKLYDSCHDSNDYRPMPRGKK
jgi:uncharacterized LabA/DUF88 family protein